MRPAGWGLGGRFVARQLGASPSVVWSIAATALLGSTFVGLAPRVLERASDDDLRQTVEASEPEQRNIEIARRTRVDAGPSDDPFRNVASTGERLLADFPESVRSVVSEQHHVTDTPPFRVSSFPDEDDGPFTTSFRFRYQDDVTEQLSLVAGRLPSDADPIPMLQGTACPDDVLAVDGFERDDHDAECFIVDVPVFETVVSPETAEAMMLEVGDDVILHPDANDPVWFNASSFMLRQRIILRVAGIVEPSDPGLEYWYADTSLHRPRITENPDFRIIGAVGVMDPAQYGSLLSAVPFVGFDHRWRNLVDADAIESTAVAQLTSDVGLIAPSDATVRTQLRELLAEFVEQRELTVALMSAAVAGVFAAAVATMLVLAALMATLQRDATLLRRDRGASRAQLITTEVVRALVLVVPPGVVGWVVASLLFPGAASPLSLRATVAFAVVSAIVLVSAACTSIVSRVGRFRRRLELPTLSRSRRLVVETAVVVVAVAALLLVRRRSALDDYELGGGSFDALLAIAPAVLAVAVGILLIRIMTPLLAVGGWFGARRRGVAPMIGFRRVRAQRAGRSPAVVIVLAIGVAVFASVVQSSIEAGRQTHAWHSVGADIRVDGHAVGARLASSDLGPALLDREVAEAVRFPDVAVDGTERPATATLLALDIDAYRRVVAHAPVELDLERTFTLLAVPQDAGVPAPIPTIMVGSWPSGAGSPPGTGTVLDVDLGRVTIPATIVDRTDAFPALDPSELSLLVPIDAVRRFEAEAVAIPTSLYVRVADDETADVAATVGATLPTARLHTRTDVLEAFTDDQFGKWVRRGFVAVTALAATFAITAAVSSIGLTSASRRRDLGYLRTLGLRLRQATAITAIEQVPIVALAIITGTGLGVATAELLSPSLDLDAFTGGRVPTELVVDTTALGVMVGAFTVALGIALTVSLLAHRRADEAALLRMGDE